MATYRLLLVYSKYGLAVSYTSGAVAQLAVLSVSVRTDIFTYKPADAAIALLLCRLVVLCCHALCGGVLWCGSFVLSSQCPAILSLRLSVSA
mgnify:CR=1 FL=1